MTEAPARCGWANGEPAYLAYHDREWGRPEGNETKLLEKLCLEGFQSGLSWATILRKREGFREAFAGFEAERMAGFGEAEVERLLGNPGIVRHRAKILAAIGNARALRAMHEKGESLAALAWSFEPPPEERPAAMTADWLRANPISPRSAALSKALKAKGFAFVGPTTCYAFMQSEGIVNDHLDTCFCRAGCEAEREAFIRPK
ncbi:DNA-3-methyladenine glycosylase I [Aureimonas endophytica]|uniref:DNA-3-methyladenine glycosylase I n=1 Tax=Aureimonas endophytica TaxID=2027858 RepID=A0A917E2N6_9HYPH|nr:DNA-3-methyladenine glycosylase I [Aureimonas endophytica]GGD97568.1 DNA-3-methyladenine glycosylase I [Aureimonas endophytica]